MHDKHIAKCDFEAFTEFVNDYIKNTPCGKPIYVDRILETYTDKYGLDKFAIAGGVASNGSLRKAFEDACEKKNVEFFLPPPILCTDNAAMIGAAAYYEYIKGVRHGYDLNAVPNLKLGERL